MKHAYLIIAHADFQLLEVLVSALDDKRNDIFIHFDKKVTSLPSIKTEASPLYILENRIDVRWGDLSVVEAEYALFEQAIRKGKYAYYHLLSGVDLPLKSQDFIHHFFEKHQRQEFIGFSSYKGWEKETDRKVRRYHLFAKEFRSNNFFIKLLRAGFLRLQFLFGYRRSKNIDLKKGTQWVSITDDFLRFVLSQKESVMRSYHHTFCSDEVFIQTLCWNSPFRDKIYCLDNEGESSLRMIGWVDGQLLDWNNADYGKLMSSDALFARKFSQQDMEIVNRIVQQIKSYDN